jgi:hypothetical protein
MSHSLMWFAAIQIFERKQNLTGLTPSTTNDRVKDTVMQYLAAHPETRDFAAAGEGLMALQTAFPCH